MSHDEHVDCSQALYRMSEYLDGEMTTEDAREIARHLTECAPCLEEHEREQIIKQLIRRSCARETAPQELRTTIMQRITTICDDGSWSEVTQVRRVSEG
ncbi:mycothiol system anti-sigma-R factor [Janibacter sp. DB-40]|uniref:mycothiol system anti-sigma-R factor n=1 Tax=Janibacter sp. DB-40 TaxID=3028808 RepID=UPI0024072725|nr:mycothiol system anti-sigma-R factor [Janibacter sp. DB-40]